MLVVGSVSWFCPKPFATMSEVAMLCAIASAVANTTIQSSLPAVPRNTRLETKRKAVNSTDMHISIQAAMFTRGP